VIRSMQKPSSFCSNTSYISSSCLNIMCGLISTVVMMTSSSRLL
jgi:hypothetical protein